MHSDSETWKQKRLLSLNIITAAVIAGTIPVSAFLFNHFNSEWAKFTDMSHWTKRTAHVVSTEVTRDWGEKYKVKLVVRMKIDGHSVEDAFFSIPRSKAETMQNDLAKASTVSVYRNNLQKNEYSLSPEMTGHMRYSPPVMLTILGAVGILASAVGLWFYLRKQFHAASDLRHRFKMDGNHSASNRQDTPPKQNTNKSPQMLEQMQKQTDGSTIKLDHEKVYEKPR